jgi:hypothetical protein
MIGDELRFHVTALSEGQQVYFATWRKGEAVWTNFDGRRRFWLLDEAESVIRHLGIGELVIEHLAAR